MISSKTELHPLGQFTQESLISSDPGKCNKQVPLQEPENKGF